ncbi:response regulator transcription factor [Zobellia nedashkovskayae]|uniref:response regulator transcription factor n=1 Tax=Zobellia nedashkovskayae TaxID=2779510 RepID=UPI001D0460F7|nr:helix-turn-helix transcriptional regulator [Zobellia nedashkovskayae]
MNLAELNDCLNTNAFGDKALVSKISEILEVCEQSKSLMVGIYMLEKGRFLYCNRALKKIFGNNRLLLFKEGWKFWLSRIDSKEIKVVKDELQAFFKTPIKKNSLTLHYHILNFEDKRICIKHELLLHKIKEQTLVLNYLFDISEKEKIQKCLVALNEQFNFSNKNSPVSAREKEVLYLIANGFSSKEIANILFISNHTAISHRKNLIEKFRVKNTAHLIKKAGIYIDF